MVTEIKYTLSLEKYLDITKAMSDAGYLNYEYVMPAKTQNTTIKCPVCENFLSLFQQDLSHRIFCSTNSCIDIGARGI